MSPSGLLYVARFDFTEASKHGLISVLNESGEVEEIEEEAEIKVYKDPGCPTRDEIEKHYATHMPYRSWCPVCVQGKGKEQPHYRKKEKREGDKPVIGVDYKSFGQSVRDDDKSTMIVVRDKDTVMTCSHVVGCKGAGDEKAVDMVVEDILSLIHI